MSANFVTKGLALIGIGLIAAGCEKPSSPSAPSTASAPVAASPTDPSGPTFSSTAPDPFTVRAPIDPYRINEPPDFMIHSRATTDVVIQRLVFAPGPGGWHTHPGPSFVLVAQGHIKLTQYNGREGCVDTQVYGPGQAYFEGGNEVHRATVVSAEPAVLHVTRFNIPVGGAISVPVSNPGC